MFKEFDKRLSSKQKLRQLFMSACLLLHITRMLTDFVLFFLRSSQSKNGFYAIASQMKLLVDTPEKVLFLPDKCDALFL